MNFDKAFNKLMENEGGYSNNPNDPGSETMYGITIKVARENNYTGPMKDLPRDAAKAIYKKQYWDTVRADELPDEVRFDVFDAAVNSGVQQSIKWLQRVLGVKEDGVLGAVTLVSAAQAKGLSAKFNGYRLRFMTDLPTWPTFGKGWARRVAENLTRLEA